MGKLPGTGPEPRATARLGRAFAALVARERRRPGGGNVTVVVTDDASRVAPFLDAPATIILCTNDDAFYELRLTGAKNARRLEGSAGERTFDSLFARTAPQVRARLAPHASIRGEALFEILKPDIERAFAAACALEDALRTALKAAGATHMEWRVGDMALAPLAQWIGAAPQ